VARKPHRPTGLAHISIAVADAERVAERYAALFGAVVRGREALPERGLRVVFLDVAGVPIELVQPVDPADRTNPVVRFLERRGEGLHHVAFHVPDAAAALAHARAQGAELVDAEPRAGAERSRVGFLQPRSTAGALIEFVEPEGGSGPAG
jgi:methylmalonyl-CoA/ethylmalonyl-CoA epimerase